MLVASPELPEVPPVAVDEPLASPVVAVPVVVEVVAGIAGEAART